jgi:hypothetical protein
MTSPSSFTPEQISTAQQVLAAARARGANQLQLEALMEAGLVESGMRNLPSGDLDSAGVFQERPSQGWQNVTNIAAATQQLLAHMDLSQTDPGAMAQSAERSAYPGRYDAVAAQASALMAAADGSAPVPFVTGNATLTSAPSSGGGGLTGGITSFIQQYAMRVSLIVFGALIMLVGVWMGLGHKAADAGQMVGWQHGKRN